MMLSFRKFFISCFGLSTIVFAFFYFSEYNHDREKDDSKNVIKNCVTQETVAIFDLDVDTMTFTEKMVREKVKFESELTPEKRQQLFVETFNKELWGGKNDKSYAGLQKSGGGSMLTFAQEMMATLQILINNFKKTNGVHVVQILDIPCGDLQWMNRFLQTRNDVIYTGMDIVPDIIKHHKEHFAHPNRTFVLQDAVLLDKIPGNFDIVICRHMLQHLRIKDIMKVLAMFSNGNVEGDSPSFFVTTNHYLAGANRDVDINPGDSRHLNLELPPFNFAPPTCIARECNTCVSFPNEHFVTVYRMPFRTVKCPKGGQQNLWRETGHKLFSCTSFENV